MKLGDHAYTLQKEKHKRIRTGFEIGVLVLFILVASYALFYIKKYQPYDPSSVSHTTNTGFIALSYTGVDRLGKTSELIGMEELDDHLKALKKQGYVTVTDKDVEDYYATGKPLPEKALYLMFEDGRKDTAIFTEKLLEKYNYHATMYSYADNLDKKNEKFLNADDLKTLEESTFWDMGSNGYRLRFINVFDAYGNYIGELNPTEYAILQSSLGRNYNHFLMDYLRDENLRPRESYRHMVARIGFDYERMRDIYTKDLGYMPSSYVLMHANTTEFGNNHDVSRENEKWIRSLFKITFNREGYSFNQRNSSPYDLTRMKPDPDWSPNHLLMRVKYDINTPKDIVFETGDAAKQESWSTEKGASEIKGQQFILTTEPNGEARARLLSGTWDDLTLDVRLRGRALGHQIVYLRADKDLKNYIRVDVGSGNLKITECINGKATDLFDKPLTEVMGEIQESTAETRRKQTIEDYKKLAEYAPTKEKKQFYENEVKKIEAESEQKTSSDSKDSVKPISAYKRADHLLHISLSGDHMDVSLDDHRAGKDLFVQVKDKGSVLVAAEWNHLSNWKQNELPDDVYDGVFDGLTISENAGNDASGGGVLYSMRLEG